MSQQKLNTIVLPNPKIQEIAQVLPTISGIRGGKECMKLAEDSELFELLARKIEKALKKAKPEGYDELEKEFQEKMREKASWIESQQMFVPESEIEKQTLLVWDKSDEFSKLSKQYRKNREEIMDREETILIHASLTEENLPEKLNSVMVARTLRYFKSDYMPLNLPEEKEEIKIPVEKVKK